MTPQERIEAHIIGEMRDDQCWITSFCDTPTSEYAQMSHCGQKASVHRLAWEIHNCQPVPPGLHVLHSCDNPKCCNPSHLVLGTNVNNKHDMVAKNRHWPNAKGYKKTKSGRYQARILINGKHTHLGTFDTPEEAHAAYLKAREEYVNSLTPFTHDHPTRS